MKKLIFPSLLLLLIGFFYSQQTAVEKIEHTSTKPIPKWNKKNFPNDHLAFQRTYPDFTFDFNAYKKTIEKEKQRIATTTKSAGFDTPWTLEGPTNVGGRINTVVADPTNPDIIYTGSAKGGIFKTIDGGEHWQPIFDEQPFLAISHIVIHPTDPNTLFVGTGDINISGHFAMGDGVYKSEDGGATWKHLGLADTRIISKIRIHPQSPDIIYVGTMGSPLERNQDRGLYKTIDGGETWEQVLFVAEDAGIVDLVMNPIAPNILYAAAWNRIRTTTESIISGDDAKIFKTVDGGENWTMLTEGLPQDTFARIGLTIFKDNPNTLAAVYVNRNSLFENIYRTDNGGENWTSITDTTSGLGSRPLGGFGWYFGKLAFSPRTPDEVFLLGVGLYRSSNNGLNWTSLGNGILHADKHTLHFINDTTLLLGTDGGLYKSTDNGGSWSDIDNIPNTQFYRVAYNPHQPNVYTGGTQDNGTIVGSATGINSWHRIFGGDGFQAIYHPTNPNLWYVEWQNGNIVLMTPDTSFNIKSGIDGSDRRNWDAPYILSPTNPNNLYTGTYRMYANYSGGFDDWVQISDDLTDGNIFGRNFHTITSITESPLVADYLYVGTSDANVWRSLDKGGSWENITFDLPERYVTSIKASPNEENTVYVTHSGFKGNGYQPHLHRSFDNGETWEDISSDLPTVGVNDVVILPNRETDNILFAATDIGVYASFTNGQNWDRLGTDMPLTLVFDMEYDTITHKLIAGTFSRSMLSFPVDSFLNQVENVDTTTTDTLANAIELYALLPINVYPNPTTDYLTLSINKPSKLLLNEKIEIININGEVILETTVQSMNQVIDVQELPTGLYFISLPNLPSERKKFLKWEGSFSF